MEDDEIMKKSGIYRYVLNEDLRNLSFHTFDKKQKRKPTSGNRVSAPIVASISSWKKWKPTTSRREKKTVRW